MSNVSYMTELCKSTAQPGAKRPVHVVTFPGLNWSFSDLGLLQKNVLPPHQDCVNSALDAVDAVRPNYPSLTC